jgi:hypothetical protein
VEDSEILRFLTVAGIASEAGRHALVQLLAEGTAARR